MINRLKVHQEKLLFLASGGFQYLLDVGLFALLVMTLGNNINFNIVSRCGAGLAGFYINGYIVFKYLKGIPFSDLVRAAIKFLLLLVFMTVISSLILHFFVNLQPTYFVLVKGVMEIVLAILSFLIQKYLVYKR